MTKKFLKVGRLYGDKDGVRVFRKAPKACDGYLNAFYEVCYCEKTSNYRAGYERADGCVVWRKNLVRFTDAEIKDFREW